MSYTVTNTETGEVVDRPSDRVEAVAFLAERFNRYAAVCMVDVADGKRPHDFDRYLTIRKDS